MIADAPKAGYKNFIDLSNRIFLMVFLPSQYPNFMIFKAVVLSEMGTGGPGYKIRLRINWVRNPVIHDRACSFYGLPEEITGRLSVFILS